MDCSKSRPAQENQLGKGLNDLEPVDAIGRIRIDDEGNMILAFGRHRSKTIAQVSTMTPHTCNGYFLVKA